MKITSRLGVLLAKIAGKEASLEHMVPPWATNAEEELMLDIADRVNGLEAGAVPEVASTDKGKYLHTNESTGALEWAEASGGSSSGPLIVNLVEGDQINTLDKTWQEIYDAPFAVVIKNLGENAKGRQDVWYIGIDDETYVVLVGTGLDDAVYFTADSASGYPSHTDIDT